MNPLMLSLLLGDDVPKSKASYDKICASDPACAAEVAKIYNADGSKVGASDADVKTAHDAIMKFDTSSSSSSSMSDLLLPSMMSGGGMQGGMQGMLPLLLLKDDSSSTGGLFGGDNSLLLMMMMGGQNGMAPIMG